MANEDYNSEDTISSILENATGSPSEPHTSQTQPEVNSTEATETTDTETLEETKEQPKVSRYKAREIEIDNERQTWARERNELKNQLDEFKKQFESGNKVANSAQEAEKLQKLKELHSQNPLEVQMALMQQMVEQSQAPLQQYIQETKNREFVQTTINGLKGEFGEEKYNKVEPYMDNILTNTAQTIGPEAARVLAQNPKALYFLAKGYYDHANEAQVEQRRTEGTKQKEALAARARTQLQPSHSKQQAESYDSNDLISQLLGIK